MIEAVVFHEKKMVELAVVLNIAVQMIVTLKATSVDEYKWKYAEVKPNAKIINAILILSSLLK